MDTQTIRIAIPSHIRDFAEARALPQSNGGRLAITPALTNAIERYIQLISIGTTEVNRMLTKTEIETTLRGMASVAIGDPAGFFLAVSDVAEIADDEELPELAAKLRSLSPAGCAALADMMEKRRSERERERIENGLRKDGRGRNGKGA